VRLRAAVDRVPAVDDSLEDRAVDHRGRGEPPAGRAGRGSGLEDHRPGEALADKARAATSRARRAAGGQAGEIDAVRLALVKHGVAGSGLYRRLRQRRRRERRGAMPSSGSRSISEAVDRRPPPFGQSALLRFRTSRADGSMTAHAILEAQARSDSHRRPWRLADHSGRPTSWGFSKPTSAWSINGFERTAARPSL